MRPKVRTYSGQFREHVLDAAADMTEAILARSATARILATSRWWAMSNCGR